MTFTFIPWILVIAEFLVLWFTENVSEPILIYFPYIFWLTNGLILLALLGKYYDPDRNSFCCLQTNSNSNLNFYCMANATKVYLFHGLVISPLLGIGKIHIWITKYSEIAALQKVFMVIALFFNLLQLWHASTEYLVYRTRWKHQTKKFENVSYTPPTKVAQLGRVDKYLLLPFNLVYILTFEKYTGLMVAIQIIKIYIKSRELEVLLWLVLYSILALVSIRILYRESEQRLKDIIQIEQEEKGDHANAEFLQQGWVKFCRRWLGLSIIFQIIDIYKTDSEKGLITYKKTLLTQLKGLKNFTFNLPLIFLNLIMYFRVQEVHAKDSELLNDFYDEKLVAGLAFLKIDSVQINTMQLIILQNVVKIFFAVLDFIFYKKMVGSIQRIDDEDTEDRRTVFLPKPRSGLILNMASLNDLLAQVTYLFVRFILFIWAIRNLSTAWFYVVFFVGVSVRMLVSYVSHKYLLARILPSDRNWAFKFFKDVVVEEDSNQEENINLKTDIVDDTSGGLANWVHDNENLTIRHYWPVLAWFGHNLDSYLDAWIENYGLLLIEMLIFCAIDQIVGFHNFYPWHSFGLWMSSVSFSCASSFLYLCSEFPCDKKRKQIGLAQPKKVRVIPSRLRKVLV